MTGAEIAWLPNPRKEAAENDLVVRNEKFLELGLEPTTLKEGLLEEVVEVAKKFAYRVDRSRVPGRFGLDQGHRQYGQPGPGRQGAQIRFMSTSAPLPQGLSADRPAASHRAYVTLVTNADYAMGALALARSIRHAGTDADIVVLHTGGVDASALEPLSDLGCRLVRPSCSTPRTAFNERHARGRLHADAPFHQGPQAGFSLAARQFLQAQALAADGLSGLRLHRCRCAGPAQHRQAF
jgi:hypothetical protein